jgi:DNA-binding NtrC family response regulator
MLRHRLPSSALYYLPPISISALVLQITGIARDVMTACLIPSHDSRELAERVKEFCPGIKVLFMSGYTSDLIAHRGVLEQGCHFIQKPFTTKGLAVQVRHAMDEKGEMTCGGGSGRTL